MILAGDEFGRTQEGNNNAYCQDNPVSWVDWHKLSTERTFCEFVRRVLSLRSSHEVFRRTQFFHGKRVGADGMKDIAWFLPNGREMSGGDWSASDGLCFGVQCAAMPADGKFAEGPAAFLLLMNGSDRDVAFDLPAIRPELRWHCLLNTVFEDGTPEEPSPQNGTFMIEGRSLALLAAIAR